MKSTISNQCTGAADIKKTERSLLRGGGGGALLIRLWYKMLRQTNPVVSDSIIPVMAFRLSLSFWLSFLSFRSFYVDPNIGAANNLQHVAYCSWTRKGNLLYQILAGNCKIWKQKNTEHRATRPLPKVCHLPNPASVFLRNTVATYLQIKIIKERWSSTLKSADN